MLNKNIIWLTKFIFIFLYFHLINYIIPYQFIQEYVYASLLKFILYCHLIIQLINLHNNN